MSSTFEPILTLLRPLYLILLSASFVPKTLFNLLITNPTPQSITSWSDFKDHWFATFWNYFGPLSQTNAAPVVKPLLVHARGVVLDIGSGQGHFLSLYPRDGTIAKIYAVEPNTSHHPSLKANATKAGWKVGDNFVILDSLIETLESKSGIKRQSIDTIVTLQVLCSIPNPQTLIPELRTYLKPNGEGRWIVCEHVRRPTTASSSSSDNLRNAFVARYQALLNWIWPEFFNGCSLTRDTKEWIERSGGWRTGKEVENEGLRYAEGDSKWTAIPSICGVLVSQ